jgi:cytochrome P450
LNEDVSFRLRNMYLLPRWVPSPRNRRFRRALAKLDTVISEIIDAIKAGDGGRKGVLARLLRTETGTASKMSPRQLRDEAVTLVLAGHETTATLLTWSLHLLSTHPAVMSQLHAELDQAVNREIPRVEDLISVGYTKQVLQEALRLYPPIWIMSRRAEAADRINGYDIAPGSNLLLSPYATHRHPGYWVAPDRFDPGRFSERRSGSRPNFTYFPFGGGPRLCIGRDMAMLEAQIILASIAGQFHLQPVNADQVRPEPLVTLRPTPNPRMIPHAR